MSHMFCSIAIFISVALTMDGNMMTIEHLQKSYKQALRNSVKDHIIS